MARLQSFDRDLKIATQGLDPAEVSRELAKFARAEVAKAVAAGAPANYDTFVNGREGAAEESVVAPGPIVYVFANWGSVIDAALDELVKRSPRRTGRYAKSFLVIVGGRTVITDFSRLRADAEVIIFNLQPYTRRIETGSMNFSVPAGHFDAARAALARRFGNSFRIESKFVNVPSGISPLAPYRLRRDWGRLKANGVRGRHRGRDAGDVLTYPALVMNAR